MKNFFVLVMVLLLVLFSCSIEIDSNDNEKPGEENPSIQPDNPEPDPRPPYVPDEPEPEPEIKDNFLGGTESEIIFHLDGEDYIFNNSDIVIENGKITDGVLANTYVSNDDKKGEAVIGFAGKNEVHGYFLPLEITDNNIDDQDEISAEFMGENVDADIIKTGDSYYVVVLLTNNHALKFGDTSLTITIKNDTSIFLTTIGFIDRKDSYSGGFLLEPISVMVG